MLRLFACLTLLAGSAAGALAHHGWGSYDANTVVTLDGPILEAAYEYPHGLVILEGEGKRWEVVLAPPSRMNARGLPREDLVVGRVVRVEGYPSRVAPAEIRAERISLDGRTIELR
ncbi:DUF6152 family protein [Ancylobacter terrae]|uniref:DUF6152 family protein n=1 Tax=Ancylobacter sp. sgz301288 TaxID=3342077 RepID=UPI0038598793